MFIFFGDEMKCVLLVANLAYMIKQFNMNNIELLQALGYHVEVACNFEQGNPMTDDLLSSFKSEIESLGVVYHQIPFQKSPFRLKDNYLAYHALVKLMQENRYAFVHCQSPVGGVLARLSARKSKTPNIYTAHGFHFQKKGSILNWILFYPIERILSNITDVMILINREDYALAKRKMRAKRIEYVPGVGVAAQPICESGESSSISRTDLGVPADAFLMLSVGELNKNKNHELVIKAMAELPTVHYVIAGKGDLENHLLQVADSLGVSERLHLLGYRSDVQALYRIADVYCHPSYREGLSVAIMEAMANDLPIVCSDIRGNRDLVLPEKGGCLLSARSAHAYSCAINELLQDPLKRAEMGKFNADHIKNFDISLVSQIIARIYVDLDTTQQMERQQ